MIAPGRGSKPTYDAEVRACVVQEVQRQPARQSDQMATWSLKLLQQAFRRAGLPAIGATTIERILHEEGYSLRCDRTCCYTGTALRVRKKGVYRARGPQAQKKSLIERAYQLAEECGIPLWNQDEADPYATRPQPGASWQRDAHPKLQRMNTCAMEESSS
jgi:hypothetical protein